MPSSSQRSVAPDLKLRQQVPGYVSGSSIARGVPKPPAGGAPGLVFLSNGGNTCAPDTLAFMLAACAPRDLFAGEPDCSLLQSLHLAANELDRVGALDAAWQGWLHEGLQTFLSQWFPEFRQGMFIGMGDLLQVVYSRASLGNPAPQLFWQLGRPGGPDAVQKIITLNQPTMLR